MALRVLVLVVCVASVGACSEDEPSRFVPDGGSSQAPPPPPPPSDAGGPGRLELSVESAQAYKRLGFTRPGVGTRFVQVGLSLRNTGEIQPLSVTPETLKLQTSNLLLFPIREQPVDVPTCPASVEVARGGTLACRATFELPVRSTVSQLVYADMAGRTASALITTVPPAASLCADLTGPSCADCIARRTSCGERKAPAVEAACNAERQCVSITGCPQVVSECTLSPACQDAIDELEGCYYDICLSFCR